MKWTRKIVLKKINRSCTMITSSPLSKINCSNLKPFWKYDLYVLINPYDRKIKNISRIIIRINEWIHSMYVIDDKQYLYSRFGFIFFVVYFFLI